MILPVKITQSSVALKVPVTAELIEGGLAVNVIDGALYTMRKNGSVIRIEGDTGNGSIASSASIALGAVIAGVVDVTGTTTITAIVLREGQTRTVRFTGALTLTNSATLVLPGGFNIVTVAGDFATFRGYAAGVTRCTSYIFSPTNVVTLTGTQTLTNKTLTSPVINVINGTPIGGTTAASGSFTTLNATDSISSGLQITITKDGDDNIGSGPYVQLRNTANTRSWVKQLSASNNIDWWHYNGGWAKYMTLSSAGLSVTGALSVTAGFGCNSKPSQSAFSVGAAATDLATAIALVNNLRTMAINNGTAA